MALKYTLKTATVMDDGEEIAIVHGLSLNSIIGLINVNRKEMDGLFMAFADRDVDSISESEVTDMGMSMIDQAPQFVAQIIAEASDAYKGHDPEKDESPLDLIMGMPLGIQMALLQKIGELTFTGGAAPKKMLTLALKAVQSGSQGKSQKPSLQT